MTCKFLSVIEDKEMIASDSSTLPTTYWTPDCKTNLSWIMDSEDKAFSN